MEERRNRGRRNAAVFAVIWAVLFCAGISGWLLVKEDAFSFGLPPAVRTEDSLDRANAGEDSGEQESNRTNAGEDSGEQESNRGNAGDGSGEQGWNRANAGDGSGEQESNRANAGDGSGEQGSELPASVKCYEDIYKEMAGQEALISLDAMGHMVRRLGESGYVAVDSENQVDMAGGEQVLEFCRQVDSKEEGSLTVMVLSYLGGLTEYDMQTADGTVYIVRSGWQFSEEGPENRSTVRYPADFWEYTPDGYLIFEGSSFAEDYYLLYMGGTPLHTALRVLPLEERCRELNRRYIAPIGYRRNDLFLLDWSEADFGVIDFYDLYDIFYGMKFNKAVPYTAGERAGTGVVYEIPAAEFEDVIMTYLDIDREVLRTKTKYAAERDCYEYRPRGFFDAEYPADIYPEVVGWSENSDGTLTLTVNAVYPGHNLSRAYTHEVVVRPLAEGGVQYVSNRRLPSGEEDGGSWHVPRLTEEEWKRAYGEE